MSRDDGFSIADTDTGMLADPKVLQLARRIQDPKETACAIVLYDAVRLASWSAGRRLALEESLPGWWIAPHEELAAQLVAVGLLDAEQRIPVHAWEGWFGPARDRRERFRLLGKRGGRASVAQRSEPSGQPSGQPHGQPYGQPLGQPRPTDRPTDRPDRPTEPPDPSGIPRSRSHTTELSPVGDALSSVPAAGKLQRVNGAWVHELPPEPSEPEPEPEPMAPEEPSP